MTSNAILGAVENGSALSSETPSALRYDNQSDSPFESTALLAKAIPAGSRVLDVGCGTGSVSVRVRDECGASIVGIEPSAERAAKARSRGLDVHVGLFPADDVPADRSFDVVLFADVLEHLVDPAAALASARDFLKPGGSVVASIPNVAHWTVRLELLRGHFRYQPYGLLDATHLRWFTRESVRSLFAGAGFEIDSYVMSAGTELEVYAQRSPWKWLPTWRRQQLVAKLAKLRPGLFGLQHVVRAKKI